jgi:hypothetical protein
MKRLSKTRRAQKPAHRGTPSSHAGMLPLFNRPRLLFARPRGRRLARPRSQRFAPPRARRFRSPKLQGEFAEMLFWIKCAALNFILSKPWGDSSRYDFIVDFRGRLSRVQVKSTSSFDGRSYIACIASRPRSGGKEYYTPKQVDFIAICVVPMDAWYIIPITELGRVDQVSLSPHVQHSKYERFREAWHLMR